MAVPVEDLKQIVKEIMLDRKIRMYQIAEQIGLTQSVFSRCLGGKQPLKELYYQRLQLMLKVKMAPEGQYQPRDGMNQHELILTGQLKQLSIQVSQLQLAVGTFQKTCVDQDARIKALEEIVAAYRRGV